MVELRVTRACAFALFVAQGCAAPLPRTEGPEPRPLGREFVVYVPPTDAEAQSGRPEPVDKPVRGKITLRRALALALLRSPNLAAVSWDVRVAEARRLQAGLRPNPEIQVEIEDWAGTGSLTGFDGAVTTILLSQLIELGGKRAARKQVAAFDAELAAWDYETARLAVLTETTLTFLDVLAAQERLHLAEESHRLAQEVLSTVAERVKAGKVSPLEEMRAGVTLSKSRIDLDKARRSLDIFRSFLTASWGSSAPGFDRAVGELDAVASIPPFESIRRLVARNPEVARWAQEIEQRLAALALERAGRVPDMTLAVGPRYITADQTNNVAFAFRFSMPLPVFDRNQGAILEARHELARAGDAKKAAEVRTWVALAAAYQTLASAHGEALSLRDDVLPAAQRAYAAARESYQEGKLGYLDILDAQRTLMETRRSYADALTTYHKAVAVVESLIGTRLDDVRRGAR